MPEIQFLDVPPVDQDGAAFRGGVADRSANVRANGPRQAEPASLQFVAETEPFLPSRSEPVAEVAPEGIQFLDVPMSFAGGAVRGAGSAIRGAGKIAQAVAEVGVTAANQALDAGFGKPANLLDGAADLVGKWGEGILDSRTPAAKLFAENSKPDGSLADASTWTFGTDPSLRGYMLQGAEALGSMAPVLVAGWAAAPLGVGARIGASAGAGGAQGGGAAIEQAREAVDGMDDQQLAAESQVYRDLLQGGADPATARAKVREQAENFAFAMTTPISTVGGALTGKILSPAGRALGTTGVLAQGAARGALSAGEEAAQETAEGIATQSGINQGAGTETDPLEGSFGNAVMGAIAGFGPGAAHGAVDGARVRSIPVAGRVADTDVTFRNGKPFATVEGARRAAEGLGDGAQVMRAGNGFIVRPAPESVMPPEIVDAAAARADEAAESETAEASEPSPSPDLGFARGQQVFWHGQPAEFIGYESGGAWENGRRARVRVNGQSRFVDLNDLREQPLGDGQTLALPAPERFEALEGPQERAALPAPENVRAGGDGFVMRQGSGMPRNAPRGIRNNNPGNIEKGIGFQGEVDGADGRFATFSSPEAGIRALARNLLTYQDKHGLDTVTAILNRWAPSSENDTASYARAVAGEMGVSATAQLNLRDPDTLQRLTAAIIRHENGMQPYGADALTEGVNGALEGRSARPALPAPTVTVDAQGTAQTADQRFASAEAERTQASERESLGLTDDVMRAGFAHPAASLDAAAHESAESDSNDLAPPSEAQKEAGNYRKGHIKVAGLDITVENPEGSERRGRSPDGQEWSNRMAGHYGYIRGTTGNDGDHVDAYVRPGTAPDYAGPVFVIDQVDPTSGAFDEHKVMMGYANEAAAREAYQSSYSTDWKGLGAMTEMSMAQFKDWTKRGDFTAPAARADRTSVDLDPGLGTLQDEKPASDILAKGGKPFLTRSAATRAAAAHGNADVVRQGGGFVARPRVKMVGAGETVAGDVANRPTLGTPTRYRDAEGAGPKRSVGRSPVSGNATWSVESRSAMKSVSANTRRGKAAMSKALTAKADVKRAMYRTDLGWVDFVWGDSKKGLQHIIEGRIRKDGVSYEQVARMLVDEVTDVLASGSTARRQDYGKATRLAIQKNGVEAVLVQTKGTNGWLLTGYRMRTEADDAGAGYDAHRSTLATPTLSRDGKGATPAESIGKEARQSNRPGAPSIDVKSAAHAADAFMAKLPGAAKLKVSVVQSVADISEAHRPSEMAEGVYYPQRDGGRIYLVADNLQSNERLHQVLAHEVVGHFGVEALLGNQFPDVLADVRRLARAPEGTRIPRDVVPGHPLYATMEAVYLAYPDYTPANRAREVLARMAETGQRPHFLARVYAKLRAALRAMGFDLKLTNADLQQMVVDAGRFLRRAGADRAQAGMLEAAASLAASSRKATAAADSRRGGEPVNLPPTVIGQNLGSASKHPDHRAAKSGDTAAAVRLAADLVTDDALKKVREAIGPEDAVIVPVLADEATGHNKIPLAVAVELSGRLGLSMAEDMYQSVRAKRTALTGLERIFKQPEFAGAVEKGRAYFLVDDTLTQGGTLASLASHITQNGGRVIGSFALTGKQYSATLRLSPETLTALRERYGDVESDFRAATGRGFDALTESEGRYLVKHDSPDAVRSRILAHGYEGVGGGDAPDAGGTPRKVSDSESSGNDKAPPNAGLFDSGGPMESRAAATTLSGQQLNAAGQAVRDSALKKIGAFADREPIRDRLKKHTQNWQTKLVQGVFDQFAPIKGLSEQAYMQARLSKGTDGAAEFLVRNGKVRLTDGALDGVHGSKGLADVLADLKGEHDHFMAWIAGNRAEKLAGEGRENLFSSAEIASLKQLASGKMPDGRNRADVYRTALREFNDLQTSVMDVAEQAGLIDGASRHLWESEFYVPFYRVMEEDQTGTMGPGQIGGLVGQRAFRKLKGGSEKLGDLTANTVANWSHLLSGSMKNLAAQEALQAASTMGVADRLAGAEKGSVRVMVKGQERHYLVHDPLVLDALTSLHYVGSNDPIMKGMRKFKHALTVGVTISPTFRLRNLMRDSISAVAINTDISANPLRNMADGWKSTGKDSDTFRRLLAGGGAVRFGSFQDGQARNVKRLVEDLGVERGQVIGSPAALGRHLRKAFDWYQEVGDRAETVNRAAIYNQARKSGKTHLEASYLARDLMDFTAGGKFAAVRLLSQVVPFMNARLQGMYKLGRGAKENPARFVAVTGAVAMASALLYLGMKDDDEYKKLPDWVRNTYWVTRIGDKFVYVPKPFEVGALGTIVERGTELAFAGDDYRLKDFGKTVASVLGDQLQMSPMPQMLKPYLEASFNYDSFRDRNIDTPSQERLPEGDRYTSRTSAGAVALGKAFGYSPQRIEHLVRGYFGWLGTQTLSAADWAARPALDMPANPSRDMAKIENWFVVGDFLKGADATSSKYTQRFYDQQREIDQVYAAFTQARKEGDIERARELAGDDKLKLRGLYQSANKRMQEIGQQIKRIETSATMPADQKRLRLDTLVQARNQLAMSVDERMRRAQ